MADNKKGYAYVDHYGFSHVVGDAETAKQYADPGTGVSEYSGKFGGGYALDNSNTRVPLPLTGSVPYGNDVRDNVGYQSVATRENFDSAFPGALGSSVNSSASLIPSKPDHSALLPSPSYKSNLDFFGNDPARYAGMITSKGWNNLDDPQAAKAFAVDYPQFFGGSQAQASLTPQQPTLSQSQAQSLIPSKTSVSSTQSLIPSKTAATVPTPALMPSMTAAPTAPSANIYTPREFVFTPPNYSITSDPSKTTFIPTIAAKQLWQNNENEKANQSLQKYQADIQKYGQDLNAWKTANEDTWNRFKFGNLSATEQATLDQAQQTRADKYTENYYSSAGLTPPLYPGDPSPSINYWQNKWQIAYNAGDQAGMDYAHQQAEAARVNAGWGSGGDTGSLTAGRMTQAGLPTFDARRLTAGDARQAQIDANDPKLDPRYKDAFYADLEAGTAQKLRSANAPYPSSGGGGSSSSRGSTKTVLAQAKAAAENDPRLWLGEGDPPEGYWPMANLIKDWYQKLSGGSGGGSTDEEISKYLKQG